MKYRKYVLITAAKNEQDYIRYTLESVVKQTVLPEKWIIVDDSSSDNTPKIIKEYSTKFKFIEVVMLKNRIYSRDFNSKINAFNIGLNKIINKKYSFLGNLDADISFEKNFYEDIISDMTKMNKLGISGGTIHEKINNNWENVHGNSSMCVGGATQFFKRDCFEKTGGYPCLKYGGEDTVIEYLARFSGYDVRTSKNLKAYHHKPSLTLRNHPFKTSFKLGIQEYLWGSCIPFELLKCINRLKNDPVIIGALLRFIGYGYSMIFIRRTLSPQTVKAVKSQQYTRLKNIIWSQESRKNQ